MEASLILCENYAKFYAVWQGQSGLLHLAIVYSKLQAFTGIVRWKSFDVARLTTRRNVVSFLRWLGGRVEISKPFCNAKSDKHVYKTRVNWLWMERLFTVAFAAQSLCLRSRKRFSDVTGKWVTNLIQFHGTLQLNWRREIWMFSRTETIWIGKLNYLSVLLNGISSF